MSAWSPVRMSACRSAASWATTAQEPTELDLGGGAAGLGDDRRGNDRDVPASSLTR
jgi:hypothetical protein